MHLSLEIIQKQISLMEEMLEFQVQQQNALEKHRAYLKKYEEQMNQMFTERKHRQEAPPTSTNPLPVLAPNGNGTASSHGHSSDGQAPAQTVPAEARETAPAAPSQPPEAIAASETEVMALIADKTGYPAEMLSLDMELTADLGIDSIKQVEIFGAMREQYPALQQWDNRRLRAD